LHLDWSCSRFDFKQRCEREIEVVEGRKPPLNAPQTEDLRQWAAAGKANAKLARDFGISRETVYTYLP